MVFALLQVALLPTQLVLRTSLTRATVPACCLGIAGVAVLTVLSHIEHRRSLRASTLLLLYYAYSVPADILRARTLLGIPHNVGVATLVSMTTACKLLLLVLEILPKATAPGVRRPTTDEKANIFSRAFLWWIVPLFRLGYHRPHTSESLPEVEHLLVHCNEAQGIRSLTLTSISRVYLY